MNENKDKVCIPIRGYSEFIKALNAAGIDGCAPPQTGGRQRGGGDKYDNIASAIIIALTLFGTATAGLYVAGYISADPVCEIVNTLTVAQNPLNAINSAITNPGFAPPSILHETVCVTQNLVTFWTNIINTIKSEGLTNIDVGDIIANKTTASAAAAAVATSAVVIPIKQNIAGWLRNFFSKVPNTDNQNDDDNEDNEIDDNEIDDDNNFFDFDPNNDIEYERLTSKNTKNVPTPPVRKFANVLDILNARPPRKFAKVSDILNAKPKLLTEPLFTEPLGDQFLLGADKKVQEPIEPIKPPILATVDNPYSQRLFNASRDSAKAISNLANTKRIASHLNLEPDRVQFLLGADKIVQEPIKPIKPPTPANDVNTPYSQRILNASRDSAIALSNFANTASMSHDAGNGGLLKSRPYNETKDKIAELQRQLKQMQDEDDETGDEDDEQTDDENEEQQQMQSDNEDDEQDLFIDGETTDDENEEQQQMQSDDEEGTRKKNQNGRGNEKFSKCNRCNGYTQSAVKNLFF
jgi:hypothetical protein